MTDSQWIKSPTARRVMEHWADARPAWLWSADGNALLWRNGAARYFQAKAKKHGTRLLDDPVPIKGQVPRLLRLGTQGRSSLSRIQFLAGERPVSATCAVTPLTMPDGAPALLIVAVDAIADEFQAEAAPDALTLSALPDGYEYLLVRDSEIVAASAGIPRPSGHIPAIDDGVLALDGRIYAATRLAAGPLGESLLVLEPSVAPALDDVQAELAAPPAPEAPRETDLDAWAQADGPDEIPDDSITPAVDPEWAEVEAAARATLEASPDSVPAEIESDDLEEEAEIEPEEEASAPAESGRLSGLFERLSHDAELYAPITPDEPEEEDEDVQPGLVKIVGRGFRPLTSPNDLLEEAVTPPADDSPLPTEAPTELADLSEPVASSPPPVEEPASDELAPTETEEAAAPTEAIEPVAPTETLEPAAPSEPGADASAEPAAPVPPPDQEAVERVSRYNFDELARILNDRVSGELGPQSRSTSIEEIIQSDHAAAAASGQQPAPLAAVPANTGGALINLGGETLVLNRLPLGILVFRDQQVLFANRAITEMIGYESVESLRNAGLASIFPAASDERPEAGPVNHLMQRDGTLVPVTARLQSISWQGKPALMLSASATEVRTGHEGAVKAFAEMLAETRRDGFVEATRAGIISGVSAQGTLALETAEDRLVGKPLSTIIDRNDLPALRAFLERPARFAETARPALTARAIEPGVEVLLFAQGQAGIVTGYFGFIRKEAPTTLLPPPSEADNDPALLGRLSRGLRRPLNTIIGFSDLIASSAFGEVGNPRYTEYAHDIKAAGQEITALVDELDDYTRLRDARYAPRPSDLDLAALLESCIIRVRGQANGARVLVRSAISERLPRIRADRASLGQAVLNLLASAIDQTPVGGAVVLSAKLEEDGSISVHVRDSADRYADRSESFVVFRDGVGRDGELLTPIRSTVGLALTRSLLAVNACSLSVDPAGNVGTIFSLVIPAELVTHGELPPPGDSGPR